MHKQLTKNEFIDWYLWNLWPYGYHMPVSTNVTMTILITTFPPTYQNHCTVELTCPSQRMRWLPSTQMDAGPTPWPRPLYIPFWQSQQHHSCPHGGWVQRIKGLLYQSPIAQNGWNREGIPLLHRCCSCFCPACLLEVSDPFWSTWLVWSGSNIISNDLSSTNYRSENMSYNNPKEDPESRVPLHPLKINMTGWKITIFNRRYIFIHGCCCFSTVMLVFDQLLRNSPLFYPCNRQPFRSFFSFLPMGKTTSNLGG